MCLIELNGKECIECLDRNNLFFLGIDNLRLIIIKWIYKNVKCYEKYCKGVFSIL